MRKARTEIDMQGFASIDFDCPHYFGYLRECAKEEGIPEECLTCERAVECMLSEIKDTPQENRTKQEQATKEETVGEIVEEMEEEEKTVCETQIQPPTIAVEPSENQFVVENLGMLYAMWSNTVRIPKETLSLWGEKVKEVEVETLDGEKARCKVIPMESSKGNVIEVPDIVQQNLGIAKGNIVIVRPCKYKGSKETKKYREEIRYWLFSKLKAFRIIRQLPSKHCNLAF